MKKNVLGMMLVLLFAGATLANAEGMKDGVKGEGMNGGMMGKGMMDKGGMMDGKMMGMCAMMQKQVIATSDGGVVIVTCNKLTKYNKDLNVVKEVELKMDMEGMQKMMNNMKSMCPMMGKIKSSDDSRDEESKESAEEEKAEHEEHHK